MRTVPPNTYTTFYVGILENATTMRADVCILPPLTLYMVNGYLL
jgi:hypothetical protein